MTFAKWPLCAAALALGLPGCSTSQRVASDLRTQQAEALQQRDRARSDAASSAVVRTPLPRLSGDQLPLPGMVKDSVRLDESIGYTTGGQTLEDALSFLSRRTGIPMRVVESVNAGSASSVSSGGSASSVSQGQTSVQVKWQGPLRGLLDQLAQASGLYWRYQAGRVEFFLYETRHFQVHLPMGSRSVSASISGGGSNNSGNASTTACATCSGSGATGGATGAINVSTGDIAVNPFASLTSTISAMLMEEGAAEVVGSTTRSTATSSAASGAGGAVAGATGVAATTVGGATQAGVSPSSAGAGSGVSRRSRVVVSPELGMITVTATPSLLDRIGTYLQGVNQRFARNVLIDLKIYDVSLEDEEGVGFSTNLLFSRLNRFGLELSGAQSVGFSMGSPGQATLTVSNANSRFNGSELVGQALSSFGKLSVVTSGQVMAVNGQPAPLQVAEEVNYLASSSSSTTSDSVTTTSLTPGSRVVGLTANFLPTVLADNRILLQYQLTMSSLISLDVISSGTSLIQTPRIASQSVQQQAFVRDGQTLVLFGFEQQRSGSDGNLSLLGASRVSSGSRVLRVIVMQVFGGSKDV